MGIINILKKFFGIKEEEKGIYKIKKTNELKIEKSIHSLWDFLVFQENTQAYHIVNVVGFDEWVDMEEIRRRIKEIFNVEYLNERSLYPYIKTLVDIGFLETINVGGRRKWKKRELLIEVTETDRKTEKGKTEKKIEIKVQKK